MGVIRKLFSFFILCFAVPAFPQEKQKLSNSYPQFNLRTSLNSWFDYDAGLMIGIGYRWSNSFSAAFEPTWIFYNGWSPDNNNSVDPLYPSGIKIRADLKFFPLVNDIHFDFFISPEFHYKRVSTRRWGSFGINCASGQCAFFQNAWYKEKKTEVGGLFKLGFIVPLLRVDQRWLLEMYGGFGLKTRKIVEKDIPIGATPRTGLSTGWFRPNPAAAIPLFPAGMKFLFLLQKK